MFYQWEQFFSSFIILGPYIMTYAWSLSFWVRLIAGFLALSQATSQVLLPENMYEMLLHPGTPFGTKSQEGIALCIATGVSGGLFAAFSEPLGLLILQLSAIYTIYTWAIIQGQDFLPANPLGQPQHGSMFRDIANDPRSHSFIAVIVCACICGAIFFSRAFFEWPRRLIALMASVAGACVGAHATVHAIYFYWSDHGRYGPLVYGLLLGNSEAWCTTQSSCKIFYLSYVVLVIVSLVTQYFVWSTEAMAKPSKPFAPKKFKHPVEGNLNVTLEDGLDAGEDAEESGEEEDSGEAGRPACLTACLGREDPDNTWAANLSTPCSCWIFLTLVVAMSSAATYIFTFFVRWTEDSATNFFIGLAYLLTNAFCLWSLIEFFLTTVWFHVIRLILGMPGLPRRDFSRGLPRKGRTILAYCLLSRQKDSSEETFETARKAHLANLDPNCRITTAVVSVSSALSIVQCEMDARDKERGTIRKVLTSEMNAIMKLIQTKSGIIERGGRPAKQAIQTALQNSERCNFWLCVLAIERQRGKSGPDLPRALSMRIEEAAQHFIYLHRNCKILKKPGQYQDLMVLASTGSNRAYTYLQEDYGDMGRKFGSECFGFKGNISDDTVSDTETLEMRKFNFKAAQMRLHERGLDDILRVSGYGDDPKNRYFYTMVLDSDTVCPANSIRKLVETAEHPANKAFGIINANLANDYSADNNCTWYMWRNAMCEVSTVNLQRGQFWVFNRVGFYGKGLIRNDMYISRLIGRPGSVIEALPIDILSHDTVEAKLLQPAIASEVTLYEDVARNPISALSQSTRWMLGEVRNGCYHADGTYAPLVEVATQVYSLLTTYKLRPATVVRWKDVPCAASAEYLSHTGFRMFHSGPAILLLNIFVVVLAKNNWGLTLAIPTSLGMIALIGTALALFFFPKAFLILDKLPSLNLGKYILCTRKASKIGDGRFKEFKDPDDDAVKSSTISLEMDSEEVSEETEVDLVDADESEVPSLSRCDVLIRQLVLAVIDVALSFLLYCPELILGVVRLAKGVWAQVTGSASWKPQDAVEKEIEQNLSVWYVFKQTWIVFTCGVAFLAYVICFRLLKQDDFWVWLLIVPWMLYPFTTYILCKPVDDAWKKSFLWRWVMDIKTAQHQFS